MRNLSIRQKLTFVAVAAALGPIPVGHLGLWHTREALFAKHEVVIQDIVSTARQVVDDLQGEVAQGAMDEAEAKTHAARFLRNLRYNDQGDYIFVYASDGTNVVLGPKPELEGKNLIELEDPNGVRLVADLIDVARAGGGFVDYVWERGGKLVPKVSYAEYDPEWQWMMGTGVYVDDVDAEIREFAVVLGGIALAVSLALAGCGLVLLQTINRPMARVVEAMRAIAGGALDTEVPFTERTDEIGTLAAALAQFKQQALERQDLSQRLAHAFETEVGGLIEQVSATAGSFEHEGASVRAAAGDAKAQATAGSSAATEASANVQTVATATEEMAASVREITARVVESRDIASEAADASGRAGGTLETLRARSAEIDSFVELVSSIAEQTNLLALNATIEAARAGDAGRGFSVVANEVKTLAGQTNKATADIAERVQALRAASDETDTELQSVGHVIERLAEIASSIAAAMEEQSAATAEIARNVQEAANGNAGVSEVITHVAEAAAASDEAAERIASAASALTSQAHQLESRVAQFLGDLRAA